MGWFLRRNKKKKGRGSAKRSSSAKAVAPRWDPKRTVFAAKVLVSFAVLVTLVVGWRYGERALMDYASARHAQTVEPEQVELVDAPLSPLARERLQRLVAGEVSADPLDGLGLQAAAAALRAEPWVRELHQVRRVAGGRVIVEADYREPMAVVQGRDGYHLVDETAVRLPGLYARHQLDDLRERGVPLIVGAASAPGPEGTRWPGDDVRAGLALVQELRDEAFLDQIVAYDSADRDAAGRLRLSLHATGGGVVRWGLPPGQEQGIDVPAAVKIDRLRQLHSKPGGAIDAGGKIVEIHGAGINLVNPAMTGGEPLNVYTSGR
ncbi:MAG: hypothetical protein WD118_05245 [Phycisphaeraceae bacterium]